MPPSRYTLAQKWVREAALLIHKSRHVWTETDKKTSHQDIVTEVDKLVEETIRGIILEHFPDDTVIGEESFKADSTPPKLENTWHIDPIDGTTNFVNLRKNFAISLSYSLNGALVFGLVLDVEKNVLYHAYSGRGAFQDQQPLTRYPNTGHIEDCIVGTPVISHTFLNEHSLREGCIRLSCDVRAVRSMGCVSLEICEVALGATDIFITMRSSPWDHNAAALILIEAGGSIRPADGTNFWPGYSGPLFAFRNNELETLVCNNYL